MEFYAVYIISSDGRPIVTELYNRNQSIPNSVISAGLLKALEDFNVNLGTLDTNIIQDTIKIDGLNYSIKKFGDFTVVLVDKLLEGRSEIIDQIGIRFLQRFGDSDLLNWKDNETRFKNFKPTINEVIDKDSIETTEDPIELKKITTADIFELDQMVQPVALAMLVLEKATIDEIASEINASKEKAQEYLQQLKSKGYISTIQVNGNTYYQAIIE